MRAGDRNAVRGLDVPGGLRPSPQGKGGPGRAEVRAGGTLLPEGTEPRGPRGGQVSWPVTEGTAPSGELDGASAEAAGDGARAGRRVNRWAFRSVSPVLRLGCEATQRLVGAQPIRPEGEQLCRPPVRRGFAQPSLDRNEPYRQAVA